MPTGALTISPIGLGSHFPFPAREPLWVPKLLSSLPSFLLGSSKETKNQKLHLNFKPSRSREYIAGTQCRKACEARRMFIMVGLYENKIIPKTQNKTKNLRDQKSSKHLFVIFSTAGFIGQSYSLHFIHSSGFFSVPAHIIIGSFSVIFLFQ